jgi:uncharacterized protein YbjQ (UPF0145 family)
MSAGEKTGRAAGEPEQAQEAVRAQAAVDEREQAESLARIEQGGIPLAAERRLRELGERGGAFTSDLSVADFALCHQLGLRPLSQVMGSSVYQMGYQEGLGGMGWGGTMLTELDTLSHALNEVRGRALGRLAEEARQVGADAVVGVHTRMGESDFGTGSIALEQVVVGTAVHRGDGVHRGADPHTAPPDAEPARHRKRARNAGGAGGPPVLTELSVADFAKLVQAGFEPCGIVAWSAVFFVSYMFSPVLAGGMLGVGGLENYELREFTQAFYSARETVMQRMTSQADSLNATGVVGVRIGHTARQHTIGRELGGRERSGLMVTFNAIGTAIRQERQAPLYPPETTVDLTT